MLSGGTSIWSIGFDLRPAVGGGGAGGEGGTSGGVVAHLPAAQV